MASLTILYLVSLQQLNHVQASVPGAGKGDELVTLPFNNITVSTGIAVFYSIIGNNNGFVRPPVKLLSDFLVSEEGNKPTTLPHWKRYPLTA